MKDKTIFSSSLGENANKPISQNVKLFFLNIYEILQIFKNPFKVLF